MIGAILVSPPQSSNQLVDGLRSGTMLNTRTEQAPRTRTVRQPEKLENLGDYLKYDG